MNKPLKNIQYILFHIFYALMYINAMKNIFVPVTLSIQKKNYYYDIDISYENIVLYRRHSHELTSDYD